MDILFRAGASASASRDASRGDSEIARRRSWLVDGGIHGSQTVAARVRRALSGEGVLGSSYGRYDADGLGETAQLGRGKWVGEARRVVGELGSDELCAGGRLGGVDARRRRCEKRGGNAVGLLGAIVHGAVAEDSRKCQEHHLR